MPIDAIEITATNTDGRVRPYPISLGPIAMRIGDRTIMAEVFDERDAAEVLLLDGSVCYRPSASAGKTRKLPE
jgi:hypothetical protein